MDEVDDDDDEPEREPEEATKKRKVCFAVNLCGASASEHWCPLRHSVLPQKRLVPNHLLRKASLPLHGRRRSRSPLKKATRISSIVCLTLHCLMSLGCVSNMPFSIVCISRSSLLTSSSSRYRMHFADDRYTTLYLYGLTIILRSCSERIWRHVMQSQMNSLLN